MNLGKALKKYQMGGKLSPTEQVRKTYGLDRPNNDTWLDIPQKTAMKLIGLGYQKPSDYLYAHGLGNVKADELTGLIVDGVFDPLNLVGVGEVRNAYKIASKGIPIAQKAVQGINITDQVNEVYNYGKKKASELNNWLGETTGYKFPNGGLMKNYSFGGDLGKFLLNSAEQAALGSFGLDFYKPKYDTKGFQVADDINQSIFKTTQGLKTAAANILIPGSGAAIGGIQETGKQISQFQLGGVMKLSNGQEMSKEMAIKYAKEKGLHKMMSNPNDLERLATLGFNHYNNQIAGEMRKQKAVNPSSDLTDFEKKDISQTVNYNRTANQNERNYTPQSLSVDNEVIKNQVRGSIMGNYTQPKFSNYNLEDLHKEVPQKQDDLYLYNNRVYQKVDNQWSWKNKKGEWVAAKNFNDKFVERNKLIPERLKNSKADADIVNSMLRDTYQMGGQMPQNIMPQNPNDLQAVTENTMEFDGSSHKQGGIPLNNGAELEKDETVIKQGAIGNKDPYAISPNLILDRETAKLVGLPSKYAGRKLSDISRMIEDMKPEKENDEMSNKTNSMNKKFALNRLIKANEILSAKHRQEQGVNEISDLRQEEMAQMQLGGTIITKDGRIIQRKPFQGEVVEEDILTSPEQDAFYGNYNLPYQQTMESNPLKIGRNMPSLQNKFSMVDTDMKTIQGAMLDRGRENMMRNQQPNLGANVLANSTNLNVPNLTIPQVDFPKEKTSFDLKNNLGNIGMGLKGASLLANFATIGKKPGQIPAQFNPYTNDILNNYRNSIDNQAIKNDVTSVLNTGLNSNPSRNWNVQRAMNSELVGKSMEAMSKANLQNQELNNRYRSELGAVQNNLGQQNVQAKNMAEVLNAQTQANWRNNLRSAIGNVGNDVADMTLKKDYLNKYTAEHIKILNEKGKDYGISFANTEEYLKAITNPEKALILGKIQKGTATPEEIQRYKDIEAGKPVDYTKK